VIHGDEEKKKTSVRLSTTPFIPTQVRIVCWVGRQQPQLKWVSAEFVHAVVTVTEN
jgi:hypothetical protein